MPGGIITSCRPKGRARTAFSPTALFAGATGGWWDVSDLTTLFKDTAGTIPCTAAGDLVARVNDKSGNGNNLLQTTSGWRPTLRNSGALWWLEFDAVDDYLLGIFTLILPHTRVTAAQLVTWAAPNYLWDGLNGGNSGSLTQRYVAPIVTMMAGAALVPATYDMTVGVNHVVTEKWATASGQLAIDNLSYVSDDPGSSNPGGIIFGCQGSGILFSNILYFGSIDIGRTLTAPEIASCRTFFGSKAGLSL